MEVSLKLPLAMVSVFFSLPVHADPNWEIPNRLGVEIALQTTGIEPQNVSLVTGRTTWRSDTQGNTHRHGTIEWKKLDGSTVLKPTTAQRPSEKPFCMDLPGHDPVPGGRDVKLFRGTDSESPPQLMLANNKDKESVLVHLQPGDTLEIVEAIHKGTGARSEHLRVTRNNQFLSVTRKGNGSRVCYSSES
jgi:hypothetical protein